MIDVRQSAYDRSQVSQCTITVQYAARCCIYMAMSHMIFDNGHAAKCRTVVHKCTHGFPLSSHIRIDIANSNNQYAKYMLNQNILYYRIRLRTMIECGRQSVSRA
eukprot:433343-Pleurochrysis_carterae.AAC.1